MDFETIAQTRMRAQRVWNPIGGAPDHVVRTLVAVQAQEFPYALWSVAQRTKRPARSAVVEAFDDGRILRTHVLRPTWHFVAREDLRRLIALSGPRVNASNARRYAELGLDAKTLAKATDVIAAAVAERHHTRRELAAILARKRISPEGQRIAHIVLHAELTGVVCSGRMQGKQHTYAAFDERVPKNESRGGDEAAAELAQRYFTTRGPATLKDFSWWSGLPMAVARRAVEDANQHISHFDKDGRRYWSGEPSRTARNAGPRVDLVQCYDETIISYTESRDVLQTATVRFAVPRIVDGLAHVVLCDGRLLGHWRTARDGTTIETRTKRRLAEDEEQALDEAVERYRRYASS